MGYTHCFRANAAYSLYGVLKGNNDNGCSSGTYINSFFTNYGVDAFFPVMEAAGVISEDDEDSYSSECQDGDDDDGDDDADGGGYGGGTSYANKGENMGSTSYGMSCNANQFVTKKFRGGNCVGQDEVEVTDNLESFNQAIEQVECVQVYSSSNNNNNNNEDDDQIATELLSSSKACSLREFPDQCPDPYGKLIRYTRALECATGAKCLLTLPETRLGRDISSIVMLVSGLGMLGAALLCKWQRKRGKSQMDLIRESSDLSRFSKASSASLSRVSSSVSHVSAKVVDAIQSYAEAESPHVNRSGSANSPGVGRTVQMQMVSSNVTAPSPARSVPGSPSALQAAASTPGVFQTPTKNVASMPSPSAAEAMDSTPSTVATFQSMKSAEDKKMAATGEPSTYGPPSTRPARSTSIPAHTTSDDEAIANVRIDEEIANSMLADTEMDRKKTYTRPTLARMSKRLFGGKKKKGDKKFEI
jgi:hypothetical protein